MNESTIAALVMEAIYSESGDAEQAAAECARAILALVNKPTLPVALWSAATGTLTCPGCKFEGLKGHEPQRGEYGYGFRYIEDVRMRRDIYRAYAGQSKLAVSADEHPDLEDTGSNPRLECRNCLAECLIPPELECDFG